MPRQEETPLIQTDTQPDYAAVRVPTKPPTEYTWAERRAELLSVVEQAGHPKAVNQSELADRYDVSQSQISQDLDRLDEYIRARISSRRDLTVKSAFDRSLRGLLDEEEWYQAAQVAKMYDDFLEGRTNSVEFRRRIERLETVAEEREETEALL